MTLDLFDGNDHLQIACWPQLRFDLQSRSSLMSTLLIGRSTENIARFLSRRLGWVLAAPQMLASQLAWPLRTYTKSCGALYVSR